MVSAPTAAQVSGLAMACRQRQRPAKRGPGDRAHRGHRGLAGITGNRARETVNLGFARSELAIRMMAECSTPIEIKLPLKQHDQDEAGLLRDSVPASDTTAVSPSSSSRGQSDKGLMPCVKSPSPRGHSRRRRVRFRLEVRWKLERTDIVEM
jgi:hypothetical protein